MDKVKKTVKAVMDMKYINLMTVCALFFLFIAVISGRPRDNPDLDGINALSSFLITFIIYVFPMIYSAVYPVSGTVPTNERQLRSAAALRDTFSGSSSIYDMLCVLPMSYKTIAKQYLRIWRLYEAAGAASVLIGCLYISSREVTYCQAFSMYAVPIIFILSPMIFITYRKPINTAAMIISSALCIISTLLMMITIFEMAVGKFIDIPSLPLMSLPAQTAYTALCVVISEVYIRVRLSYKKHYARNGEEIK